MNERIHCRESFDVVIIGGGPAGATLATFLQRKGHSCLILESSKFPRYHIGESLIPNTYGTLDRLGLLPLLRKSQFPKKHSVRFVSESGKSSDPFYFFESIEGERAQTWQVEREEFDTMCLTLAQDSGVDVRMETRVERVLFEDGQAVGVSLCPVNGEPYRVASRVVVDASGRKTVIGSQLGLKEGVPGLEKASLWTYFKGGKRLPGIDEGETTIFMIPDRGWFWYIPLPDDRVSVGIVTSPDFLLSASSKKLKPLFFEEVEKCLPLKERLKDAVCIDDVRGLPKLAYRNRKVVGNGWLMVGDAAAFLDPIYSSGLYLALGSAELAANSVHRSLVLDDLSPEVLGAHLGPLQEAIDTIKRLIFAFYNPNFNFGDFSRKFPEYRSQLIDCLVGDVLNKDMDAFKAALDEACAV